VRPGAGDLGRAAGGGPVNDPPATGIVVRTRWLRVASPSVTTLLELFVYLVVVAATIPVAARAFVDARTHLGVLEGVFLAQGARVAIAEYRSVVGNWPASNRDAGYDDPQLHAGGRGAIGIRSGGAADFTFSHDSPLLADQVVSFRAWQGPDSSAPMAWLCAHARSPALEPASTDRTTLRERELPLPCRAG
jgi:type IV pilus assembly protein PilA